MGDSSNSGGNLAHIMKGLKLKFSGKTPADFKDWRKETCLILSINRKDLVDIMKGAHRPEGGDSPTEESAYDKASQDLYTILYLLTEKPELESKFFKVTDEVIRAKLAELAATSMKPEQDPDDYFMEAILKRNEVAGMGEPMTDRRFKDILVQGFTDEYDPVKFQIYRDSSFGLDDIHTTMRHLYLDAKSRRSEASGRIAERGAVMSTESVTCCNPNCDQHAPRGVAMSAESVVCHRCNKQGHYKRNCPELANGKGNREKTKKQLGGKSGSGGGAGQTWCSFHNTTTHSDSECYAQGAPRPQQGSAYTACTAQRSNLLPPDGDSKTSELSFGNDFDGGFLFTSTTAARTFLPNGQEQATLVDAYTTDATPSTFQGLLNTTTSIITIAVAGIITIIGGLWELLNHRNTLDEGTLPTDNEGSAFATLTNGRMFQPNYNEMTMLVDSGATEHFLDDELIPGLKDRLTNPTPLDVPKTIITAGNRKLLGTMTGTIHGTITDQTGKTHRAQFPSLIVSGLGRHIFSPTTAMTRGITTTLEEGNSHLRKGDVVVQLEQQPGDRGLCSLKVGLDASDSGPSAIALTAQVSADTWHRRLGHMNPRSMELLRKTGNNDVDYTGTVSGCDICHSSKSRQKAHPKESLHTTTGPMELVYTDLMGPITPAARGGYKFIAKFTDDFSRMKEIFLLKTKQEAAESIHLYNMTVATPLGLRIQRLRSDKGGEYISKESKQLCINSGITMEYTATAPPQQNGVSERTGQTLATMVRCMLKDGNFPDNMWGELFFTAVYLSNRSPHAALGRATPFSKMHNKEADMSVLRVIGARAFVHIETYTTTMGGKAFEGKLCGFSPNSRAYRIYNAEKGTVIESRNVTFLECPAYKQLPTGRMDCFTDEDATYARDAIDHKFFLDENTSVDSPEAHAARLVELERLLEELRENSKEAEDRTGTPSPVITPTASSGADAPSSGTTPAAREMRVTRASTRTRPNSDDNIDDLHPVASLLVARAQPRANLSTGLTDFAHDDIDQALAFTDFIYATGSFDHTGLPVETDRAIAIPNRYQDAINSPQSEQWIEAINKEMDSLKEHEVYYLVPTTSVPKGQKIIGSRLVFKQKADGRFKARLVVQGYVQEPGNDYGKSYAPVCRIGSIRVLLATANEHGWPVHQLDVQVAFLQCKITSDVYVKVAPGQEATDPETGVPMVYKLRRSLYGLAQSPVLWYDTIDAALVTLGFTPTQSDPCVYTYGSNDTLAILTLYVDDILVTGGDAKVLEKLKTALMDRFAMTNMGEVSRILGMTVTRDYEKGTLTIDQKDYALATLERFGMLDSNPVHTPGYGLELSTEQPEEKLLGATGIKLYQAIVGSLLYLTQVSRYDMCYAINQLTRGCSKPAKVHMSAAKHVLRYLKGSTGLPIIYKQGQFQLHAYTDASFAANPDNRKSTSSFLFFLAGGPISFGAKTQTLTAQSTVESEMMAVSYGMKEAVYLSNFLGELGFKSFNTVPVNCDSTGAMSVFANRSYSSRTKHVALRFFFIRELVKSGRITLHHVPTGAMLADVGTKHLSNSSFRSIMQQIKDFSR